MKKKRRKKEWVGYTTSDLIVITELTWVFIYVYSTIQNGEVQTNKDLTFNV